MDEEAYNMPLRENVFKAVETLRETIRENRPFYAHDVFQHCDKLFISPFLMLQVLKQVLEPDLCLLRKWRN